LTANGAKSSGRRWTIPIRTCCDVHLATGKGFGLLIPATQLELLATWLDMEPEVPEGEWYKRFSGVTVCGEGELIKTFLLPGQAPKGKRVS
jgi:hypothetical protein